MTRHRPPRNQAVRTNNRYVYAAPSRIQGSGLFAREPIPAGTDLVEYDGLRIMREEGERLARKGSLDGGVAK